MLAALWSDVAWLAELLAGLGAAAWFAVSHPGTYGVIVGGGLMVLVIWKSPRDEDGPHPALRIMQSIPRLGGTLIAVLLVTAGLLNLFGVLALVDTTERTNRPEPIPMPLPRPKPGQAPASTSPLDHPDG